MADEKSQELLIGEMIREYMKEHKSHDYRDWHSMLNHEKKELLRSIWDKDSPTYILNAMSRLMYTTVGFNYLMAGLTQLDLIPDDLRKELEGDLASSSKAFEQGANILPSDTDYFKDFQRVHEVFMKTGAI